jgi:hypothetical protein
MAALLKGQMLANSRNLLTSLVLFAGILGAARAAGARARGSVIALALWTLCLEGLQCWITPRSGDITTPLLVLLASAGLALLQAPAAGTGQPRPAPTLGRQDDAAGPSPSEPARKPVHPLWLIGPAVTAMALGISWGLHRPGIPYNVVDLFRGHAHPAALVAFALALLWLGAGPAWLGRWVAASSKPWLVLPLGALACSLVALALTWSAATTESIEDVAGSANLVWFVTQRDIWGVAWRHIFLALDQPAVIGFLEHCVRWSALYGPAPLVLGSLIALQAQATRPTRSTRTTALWLLAGGLTLWLCKGIAFDWSSTDNLNELIARDGPWGWGGGGYLYGLLGLLCVNSWLLGRALTRGVGWLAGALLLSALAMPLGWALLNEGLNPAVQKYDLVYSGVQFLLGPDRKHLLSTEVLMLRWFGLQAATVLVVASGIWMEHCVWRWRSAQASTAG